MVARQLTNLTNFLNLILLFLLVFHKKKFPKNDYEILKFSMFKRSDSFQF